MRPEVQMDWQLTRLRRYFCHIVEQLFNVPHDILREVIPTRSYLALYRLIENWCPYGQPGYRDRIKEINSLISSKSRVSQDHKTAIERFHREEQVLVPSATSAMAVLLVRIFIMGQLLRCKLTIKYSRAPSLGLTCQRHLLMKVP